MHAASSPLSAQTQTPGSDLTDQFLRFVLRGSPFAMPIEAVREILEVAPTTALPLMPSFVRGVMNLRGAVVPVIDLAARFGWPVATLERRSCIVVAEIPASDEAAAPLVLGLLVDAVHEVLDVPAGQLEPAPALGTPIEPVWIAGIARIPTGMVTVLDLARCLDSEELARLIAPEAAH